MSSDHLTCAMLNYYHALRLGIALREYRMMILRRDAQGSPSCTIKPDVVDSSTHRNFEYRYTDAKHRNAVTEVFSAQTGSFAYNYDDVGNMVQRNRDVLKYDAQNKLVEMNTTGGDTMKYVYDSGGMRIKKSQKSSGVVVYSFDGLYEIARTPGQAEKHTLYFKGLYGDIFSQLTRNDAALVTELREPQLPNFTVSQCSKKNSRSVTDLNKPVTDPNKPVTEALECDPTLSIVTYYKNKLNDYSHKTIVSAYNTVSKRESMFVMYGIFLLLGYAIYLLQQNKRLVFAPTPLLLLAYMIVFTDCGNFNSTKKGEAPWLLLASGINKDTPSVDDASTSSTPGLSGSSGGGTVSPVVPVTGMFFLHPDHLGSITMISDGYGNVISGGNNGGKSSMNYKPYGEMNRTDSSGPDITRFKYTGQEEDKETGLLYYKARYYDPSLGRFLQADSVVNIIGSQGLNRYMYTDGNPVKYKDLDGHNKTKDFFSKIGPNMLGAAEWASKGLQNAGKTYSNALFGKRHNETALSHPKKGYGDMIDYTWQSLTDPAVMLGNAVMAANLAVAYLTPYGWYHQAKYGQTSISYRGGGIVMRNSPLMGKGGGLTLGRNVFLGAGADGATLQHELGHVQQWQDWGGSKYLGHTATSPIGGARWAERDANQRSGANAYPGSARDNPYAEFLFKTLLLKSINGGLSENESVLLTYSLYWLYDVKIGFKTK
jgi:RHS repeat-associated protein